MIGLLRIKLGACRTGPTKRLRADLHTIALLCNRARNAMARAWLRWREDHPDWTPPVAVDDEGRPRQRRDGSPILVCPMHPLRLDYEGRPISFRTWLYHAGRTVVPQLSVAIVSMLSGEVEVRLKSKMPYNHTGLARQRWEAVLLNEVNLDTYRSLTIPVPNNNMALCYGGATGGREAKVSRAVQQRLHRFGDSGCTLALPLWSDRAGRQWKYAVVALRVSAHSAGNRALIRRVTDAASGWKLADSELVFVDGKGWFFHLTYQQPDDSLPQIESSQVAVLQAQEEGDYPFVVTVAGEPDRKPLWKVGKGPHLLYQFRRLDARRRAMRTDYGTAGHGRQGHGQQRNQRDIRPVTRAVNHLVNDVAAQTAAEIIRFCSRHQCGKLLWQEPHIAARPRLWFAQNRVQWDWTLFQAKLNHQCRKAGVTIVEPEMAKSRTGCLNNAGG